MDFDVIKAQPQRIQVKSQLDSDLGEKVSVQDTQEQVVTKKVSQSISDTKNQQEELAVAKMCIKDRKKIMIGVILLVILLIGAGISIGITIGMQTQFKMKRIVYLPHKDNSTTQIRQIQLTTKYDHPNIPYTVYTSKVEHQSSRRLLKQQKQHNQIDIHIVFDKHGITFCIHENKTIQVHIDSDHALNYFAKHNQALVDFVKQYEDKDDDPNMPQNVINILKILIDQVINKIIQSNQTITINVKPKTIYIYNQENNHYEVKPLDHHHRRRLWHWSLDFHAGSDNDQQSNQNYNDYGTQSDNNWLQLGNIVNQVSQSQSQIVESTRNQNTDNIDDKTTVQQSQSMPNPQLCCPNPNKQLSCNIKTKHSTIQYVSS